MRASHQQQQHAQKAEKQNKTGEGTKITKAFAQQVHKYKNKRWRIPEAKQNKKYAQESLSSTCDLFIISSIIFVYIILLLFLDHSCFCCVRVFAYILCLSSEILYHPRLERKRPCILIIVFISFGCSSVSTLTYTFNIVACHTFFALQSFFFFFFLYNNYYFLL